MRNGEPTPTAGVEPLIGRAIGNYRVERKLGEGGMGSVYRLRHDTLPDTFAAIKVLNGDAMDSPRAQRRFQQEAKVAAAVGNHRVVRPLDVGVFPDGIPYIMMEYVAGRSLDQELVVNGPMPVTTAVKIAGRVADTMAIAHLKGIIHRDLKPPNIMLPTEGERDAAVKLLDFGVAKASGALKVAHTNERAVIGTPGYMSPEAVSAVGVDGRSDVFSLGVILFEMLTGELPFPAPDPQAALVNVLTMPLVPAGERRPSNLDAVPSECEAILRRALAKDPAERFTMSQFHEELAAELDRLVNSAKGLVQREAPLRDSEDPDFESPTLHRGAAQVRKILDRLDAQKGPPSLEDALADEDRTERADAASPTTQAIEEGEDDDEDQGERGEPPEERADSHSAATRQHPAAILTDEVPREEARRRSWTLGLALATVVAVGATSWWWMHSHAHGPVAPSSKRIGAADTTAGSHDTPATSEGAPAPVEGPAKPTAPPQKVHVAPPVRRNRVIPHKHPKELAPMPDEPRKTKLPVGIKEME